MDHGIVSFGAYIPRLRLARASIAAAHRWMAPSLAASAKGARAFCSWDEDAITMAVEAGRDCLRGCSKPIREVIMASTTFPYHDLSNSGIVAGALGCSHHLQTSDRGGSQRAATSALIRAFESKQEGVLLLAADRLHAKPASQQEMAYGAGAVALALGSGDILARCLGFASVAAGFVDHVRAADQKYDYFWEERWIRDEGFGKIAPKAIGAALEKSNVRISDVAHFIMPSVTRGIAQAVGKSVGFAGEIADGLDAECGYTGAAHALLMLAHTLESAKAGDKILVVGFGQGADALVLEATGHRASVPNRRGVSGAMNEKLLTEDYLRMLSFHGDINLEWGMRAEKSSKPALTEAYRSDDQLSAFRAGKCRACGTVQFPQSAYCVNPACKAPASQFEQVSLADEPAKVLTFTADWLSYHPAPPLYVGFIQFENGARLLMETVDGSAGSIDVGVPVRMVFRIKERDQIRGFNRYFWKATPINI